MTTITTIPERCNGMLDFIQGQYTMLKTEGGIRREFAKPMFPKPCSVKMPISSQLIVNPSKAIMSKAIPNRSP